MGAQVAVNARALEADEAADVDGRPRILGDCEDAMQGEGGELATILHKARVRDAPPMPRLMAMRLARFAGQSMQIWFSGRLMRAMSFLRLRVASLSSAL